MFEKTRNTRVLPVAVLSAMFLSAGAARADGGDYLLPASYTADGANFEARDREPVPCAAQREASWFLNELQRSDGQVEPSAPTVRCAVEMYAESTVDYE